LKFLWILLILLLLFGLLPVKIPNLFNDFKKPNVLLIDRQVCGCDCAEGRIKNGTLKISQNIMDKYPELGDKHFEVTLTNFPPFDNLSNDKLETFDFANHNTFKVTGNVIGVDTVLCNPESCEIVPKFQVNEWTLTSYYPKFFRFNTPSILTYFGLWIIALPAITVVSIFKAKRKNN